MVGNIKAKYHCEKTSDTHVPGLLAEGALTDSNKAEMLIENQMKNRIECHEKGCDFRLHQKFTPDYSYQKNTESKNSSNF